METKKDRFLENVKKFDKDPKKYEDKAFTKIIDNLMIKNIHGREKAMGLDEYDAESKTNRVFIPGHIYMFKYITKNPTKYDNGNIKFEYYDSLPIILCTSTNKNIISGINLNLCNKDLRALILNTVYNIDPEFFDREASKQAHQDLFPISKKITGLLRDKEGLSKLLNTIVQRYKLNNISLIYRNYDINHMQNVRFMEVWQWQYIPFINYKQSIKEPILKLIQKVTRIDQIKM